MRAIYFAVTSVLLALALAAPARAQPTMLVVHGGGWYATGPVVTNALQPVADRFAAAGFDARLVDYAPGAAGFADVIAAYDAAAAGGDPVCAYGESAGGHWSLLLASVRPVACVIAVAAPTDLADTAALPLRDLATKTLGPVLVPFSPMAYAPLLRAPTLFSAGFDDRLVPPEQARRLAATMPGPSEVVELPPGTQSWMHGTAAPAAVAALESREVGFARAAVRGAGATAAGRLDPQP